MDATVEQRFLEQILPFDFTLIKPTSVYKPDGAWLRKTGGILAAGETVRLESAASFGIEQDRYQALHVSSRARGQTYWVLLKDLQAQVKELAH